jgi:hypothetical protein
MYRAPTGRPVKFQHRWRDPGRGRNHQWARMRYFRTEVPFLSTGTLNWAAQALVFVYL